MRIASLPARRHGPACAWLIHAASPPSPAPQYKEIFDVPVDRLQIIQDAVIAKVEAGLKGDKEGLDMLPTYVDILPSGCVGWQGFGTPDAGAAGPPLFGTPFCCLAARTGPGSFDLGPCRKEQGDYYAIDLGGTNLRVMHMHLAQGVWLLGCCLGLLLWFGWWCQHGDVGSQGASGVHGLGRQL